MQQNGDGTLGTTISQLNGGNVNAITPATAQQYGFKYQLVEATLSGASGDLGDISALNTFGIPVSLSDSNGTRSFAPGISGSQIKSFLNTQGPGSLLSPSGLAVGPAQGSTLSPNPWPSADWTNYVTALKNNPTVLKDITLVSPFTGSPQQATASLSQYGVSYDSTNDYFVLTPNTTNGATNTDYIRIKTSELLKSIYAQTGVIEISTQGGAQGTYAPTTSFTPNTADGAVAKYFVAGFDAGYWGGSGSSPNPQDPTKTDLSKTWGWNVNYAYDATLTNAGIAYTNSLGTGSGTAGGNNRFYDPWAQEIQKLSNTYGWSYGDLISQGGTNPQISLWNATSNAQVQNIDVKLFSNSETLKTTDGFVTPPLSYVPPSGSSYSQVNTATQGNVNEI